MKLGIIDIGSNTIKAYLYDTSDEALTPVCRVSFYAMLSSHVTDGAIDSEGLSVLAESCIKCHDFLLENGAEEIRAYATEALRSASNSSDAVRLVKEETGIIPDILTREQEAECDALSLMHFSGKTEGIGMDIGGGSGQIFEYKDGRAGRSISAPIGALAMKNRFVSSDIPAIEELGEIDSYVRGFLEEFVSITAPEIDVMGGSASSVAGILADEDGRISLEELNDFIVSVIGRSDAFEYISSFASGRETTLIPGLEVIRVCGVFFRASSVRIFFSGSREGYIIKNGYFGK